MNDTRITREELYIKMASLIALRGTCKRKQVGCIITRDNRIISTGYNGPVKGQQHCNPSFCEILTSCTNAIHAEANAIAFAAREGVKLDGATLYCTLAPCKKCSELIIQTGIKEVIFFEQYDGYLQSKYFLFQNGVKVTQHEQA